MQLYLLRSFFIFRYSYADLMLLSGEEAQVNIMGNINEPFASSNNRFDVAFTTHSDGMYSMELTITGLWEQNVLQYCKRCINSS